MKVSLVTHERPSATRSIAPVTSFHQTDLAGSSAAVALRGLKLSRSATPATASMEWGVRIGRGGRKLPATKLRFSRRAGDGSKMVRYTPGLPQNLS